MNEGSLIVIVIVVEALLHCIDWRRFLLGKELPRLAAYVLGVLGLMVPFTVWLYLQGHLDIAFTLWKVIVAGGAAVLLGYAIDAINELRWTAKHGTEREAILTQQVKRDPGKSA